MELNGLIFFVISYVHVYSSPWYLLFDDPFLTGFTT